MINKKLVLLGGVLLFGSCNVVSASWITDKIAAVRRSINAFSVRRAEAQAARELELARAFGFGPRASVGESDADHEIAATRADDAARAAVAARAEYEDAVAAEYAAADTAAGETQEAYEDAVRAAAIAAAIAAAAARAARYQEYSAQESLDDLGVVDVRMPTTLDYVKANKGLIAGTVLTVMGAFAVKRIGVKNIATMIKNQSARAAAGATAFAQRAIATVRRS